MTAPFGRALSPAGYGAVAAAAWARGATLVYGPLADALADRSPDPLTGRRVLDVGAGTGVGSVALERRGAHPIAVDFSVSMLTVDAANRPPAVVGDATALPIESRSVEGAYAAFVLNHVTNPVAGLRELSRVCRPGDPLVAGVFSAESRHDGRDAVDQVAIAGGWSPPGWYVELKRKTVPLLGSDAAMAAAAAEAGLADIEVEDAPVDVGLSDPRDLVAYRFGQAQFADFIAGLADDDRTLLVDKAGEAAASVMTPYRPRVIFLAARASEGGSTAESFPEPAPVAR